MPNLSQHRQTSELVALGAAIKSFRMSKKISQEDLALIAGVDRSYLGRVERGDNNVAILTLHRIARALDVSLTELFRQACL